MPWNSRKLNDGRTIPEIAFGTWTLGNGQDPIDYVDNALDAGFSHLDTAQAYGNEKEVGIALRESGLAREDVFITTKFSGRDGLSIEQSIRNSLDNLGVKYVDLYLIHHPRLAQPDIPSAWAVMEKIQAEGLAKSIGVSNFEISDLTTLLASAKVKPAANQILLHPYVNVRQAPLVAFCKANDIVVEAYSALTPLTRQRGGPVDKPVNAIAARLDASPDQVLLAWARAKGAVLVTMSSKKERVEGYLKAGDIELTSDDVRDIDVAGALGVRLSARTVLRRVAGLTVLTTAAFGVCTYLGVEIF
ncbi:Aldo/keto reductase [Punctularia strigosozonata HHB-11173 SS5]|uniref:Aldo/keto reductase n=1 Tax=Punctularia strigosozonata (strain HHB-11173) TaxID=741275 RepID=R7S5N5_PUNST|nr:Aldo/keto reductase [Punctularia strigosozonata HHB-11173 SS5]EIN04776.1 Aldo/keto reductase [Punctularia strigosozonata HHB-11173 SS5]